MSRLFALTIAALLAGCPAPGAAPDDTASKIADLLKIAPIPTASPTPTPGPARTIAGSWKAYKMDYTTNPPSSVTSTVFLKDDGSFEMKSGSAYQGGGLTRMSSAGAGTGSYELRGDALKLKFEDSSELTGSVAGENLAIDGKNYYPCSGFAC